ncbi:MAG TPA: hypothetical protein VEL07_04415 [Planctomycetota bacterium]|nr:hypothetical protein [Planctomycetota bacterium]
MFFLRPRMLRSESTGVVIVVFLLFGLVFGAGALLIAAGITGPRDLYVDQTGRSVTWGEMTGSPILLVPEELVEQHRRQPASQHFYIKRIDRSIDWRRALSAATIGAFSACAIVSSLRELARRRRERAVP